MDTPMNFKDYFTMERILDISRIHNVSMDKVLRGINFNLGNKVLYPKLIKKQMGKKVRNLYVDPRGSILYQQIVLHYLDELFTDRLVHKSVFSYRKRHSTLGAINYIKNQINNFGNEGFPLYKIDISDYFNSIQKSHIEKVILKLRELGCDESVLSFIDDYTDNDKFIYKGKIHNTRPCSPQGSPLSSFISNIVLYEMDKEISKKYIYVRYADDILTNCPIDILINHINHLGFKVNQQKIKIYRHYPIEFLGLIINKDKINLTKEKKREYYLNTRRIIREIFRCYNYMNKDERLYISINEINKYWFIEYYKWSRFDSLISKNIDLEDFGDLDSLIRNTLRASYTGKNNKSNYIKLTDKELYNKGLISFKESKLINMNKDISAFDTFINGKLKFSQKNVKAIADKYRSKIMEGENYEEEGKDEHYSIGNSIQWD